MEIRKNYVKICLDKEMLHVNLSVDKKMLHVTWKFVCRQGNVTRNMEI